MVSACDTCTVITPAYAQRAVLPVVSIGNPPNNTVGAIGIHGPGTIGIHGVGAPTALHAANAGFAGLVQIPQEFLHES